MSLRHRYTPSSGPSRSRQSPEDEAYNIIPVHNLLADHPSLRFPEVRAAAAALRTVGNLRKPPFSQWLPDMDLLDWLALFFGFQRENVRNQREHLVLHLANAQMRLTPPPDNIDTLDGTVLRRFRKKLLKNYTNWCSYLGKKSNIWISDRRGASSDQRRELLYVSLYLLIWGEAANIRFVPECICYIFHNMAMELNKILEDYIDENTGQPVMTSIYGENAFLNRVVKPIYETIKSEVESSKNGTAPHGAWRNYDDINEYFWTKRCFEKLKWPIDVGSNFFVTSSRAKHVGKTGFVEQRSFLNLIRSFDRLWVMLILFLQAAIIVAWEEKKYPWQALEDRDVQVRVLTIFFTWSSLRFLQSLLDVGMQYRLVSRETKALAVRMALKCIVAAAWIVVFGVFYGRIWSQRNQDRKWSAEANRRVVNFLEVALVFIIPELLALALFIIPWIRNFIENTNWRIFYMLSWWFQSRSFVGRGLREGLVDNIKYTLFWIVVLATKFCFSFFLQIKPMIAPSKALVDLKDVHYVWHEFLRNSNRLAVGLLWLPVVLIYLMDIQIWYSIYSSFVGAGVGLFAHLGEIRNIQQLRLRFQFFASAIQFNLMPEEQLLNARGTLRNKFKDAIHRLKLRYGLGRPYRKLESNQVEANKFALIWNEIIMSFREEDIISDREFELLELAPNSWNVRVIRWPCFLLCNELLLALSQGKELVDAPDRWLWKKICKNEYRRCAVIEAYDCIKYLLLEIIKPNCEEHSIVTVLFQEIDHSIEIEKFTKTFKTTALPQLHNKLIKLVELLTKPKKDSDQLVNTLQALYEIGIRDFFKEERNAQQLSEDGLAPRNSASSGVLPFATAIQLPDANNENFYRQVRRLHTILTSRDSMQNIPVNLEARRRIAFFSNSLFMNIPHAPQVEKMMAFSVLTPYYNEEVLYSKEQLKAENEDGISILYYLQTIYDDEWKNFMERMRREGMMNDSDIWTDKLRDLRLWASYRGQTLSRTVRGMMYYYRALKMLVFLDSASEMDIREGSRELGSMRRDSADGLISERSPSSKSLSRASSSISLLFKGHEYGTALMKFTYVVACQIYGSQKEKKDPRADDILYLMKNNEALRVAYVDEVTTGRDGKEYYSVLVKYDQQLEKEVEIYRIKLPGPLKLGEGKPENQNHAMIFTRGDAIQTIDMNQDNYFEEALKMRNLLEEYRHYYGIRKPTILGVREHIFTGSVSSLAWFMSAQETSFVTLGQRVLANPLKVRMHYGHPDVFDRFWFLTRGGISKASRVINISEDIFAGFNCTLRGGNVTHHEYIQVGKGRDVGLNQVSMFEAKVASGNGEQVLSRDVYRLGHRLDFFRMLSFFYTTVGFFFNTMMVVLTVYAFLWGRLYLALSGVEAAMASDSNNNKALGTILNQQFIIQLGIFTALPMIVENSLELGFLQAIWDFLTMQLQLSSVFYTFSMGTRSHFFGRTILHGGAKYRATGRGFVVEHKSFAENYRLYARSHFVKAVELGLILIIYASHSAVATDTFVYIAMTISSWFLVASWIMAPFVFNPSGFDWLKTVYDFDDFMNWIWYRGSVFAKAEQSWEQWWYEEQDHLKVTGLWGKLLEIILDLRFFFFQYGIVYQLGIADGSTSIAVYLLSWICVFVFLGIYMVVAYARDKYAAKEHIYYRLVQFLVIILAILVIIALLEFTELKFVDIFTSLLAFIPTGWGLILIAQVFRTLLNSQHFLPKSPIMSLVPRATSHARLHKNGLMTPRSRGRSAIYSMARTPYARVYPTSSLKGVRLPVEGGPSSSAQSALDHHMLTGSKQGQALKHRSSVLDNDIGSVGPIRRIRQKSNITSRGLSSSVSGSPLSVISSVVGADSGQRPSSYMQKPLLLSEARHSDMKLSMENTDDAMPSTSFPPIPSKSSEMASKILQQLDKLVSPKEKSSELKLQTTNGKSPTKLSPSMLHGQALRSMETVDSSKLLDNIRDDKSDGLPENLFADAQKLISQKDKPENGPLNLVATDGFVPVVTDADTTMPRKEIVSTAKSLDFSTMKSVSYPAQKRRAFRMSAQEDYLDLDDDVYPNGAATSFTEKEMTDSTLVDEKTAATETIAQEKPPASSVAIPFKSSKIDDKNPDGSIIGEKVDISSSITTSTCGLTFKPVGAPAVTDTQLTLGSDKSALLNGSIAAPSLFNFGGKVAFSTELTTVDTPLKELTNSGPIFSFGDKVVSLKKSVADDPLFKFGANKNVDQVPQMPFTSSSIGAESAGLTFGASSDSKLGNSVSSTVVCGATDLMPKVPESYSADAKTNTDTEFSVQSSELAVSSAASTSLLTSSTSALSFGHNSNQNGAHASSNSFSSPLSTLVSNNFTSQNMFSTSSLAASSSNSTTASTSSSLTTSTPVTMASSNSSSSSSLPVSSSLTNSFFKFGSSTVLSTDLAVSSSCSEPLETKSKQDAGLVTLSSTAFGNSSAAVGSTGNSIFGFSSSTMTTVNSQSQGSLFGSSTSLLGAQASPATSGFATSTHSQSIPFGSSTSSLLFGLSGNAAFSSGNSLFPSSSPATNIFNSGTYGLSSSASSSAANSASSNSGTTSLFGLSSWQPSKSPFGSTFSSSSSSAFSFGASTGYVASTTSSPMMFGSSTGASSSPVFSFTSTAADTSTQPVFGSPNAVFTFGSASSVNNDQMSMEDSMAEDTVQAAPSVTPVFGQPPAPPQSNFVFGASAPSGASPYQFGSQQNSVPQNPTPFQPSGSLEFNAGGSFSLGTGGGDKSGRKYVKVKHRPRKK